MKFARALFAGPGACRALVDGARGHVELVLGSSGGAYVRLGWSDWVLLTRPGEPFGPLSVAVDGLDRLELRPGTPAEVTRGRLWVGGQSLSLERMRERPSSPTARAGSGVACVALPAAPAPLSVGIAALAGGRVADGVRLLAGLGDGLTPAGDDVLAGYAAARVALGASGVVVWSGGHGARRRLALRICAVRSGGSFRTWRRACSPRSAGARRTRPARRFRGCAGGGRRRGSRWGGGSTRRS